MHTTAEIFILQQTVAITACQQRVMPTPQGPFSDGTTWQPSLAFTKSTRGAYWTSPRALGREKGSSGPEGVITLHAVDRPVSCDNSGDKSDRTSSWSSRRLKETSKVWTSVELRQTYLGWFRPSDDGVASRDNTKVAKYRDTHTGDIEIKTDDRSSYWHQTLRNVSFVFEPQLHCANYNIVIKQ